jgi:hypothetical protein
MIPWPAAIGSGPLRKVEGLFFDNVEHPAAIGLRGTTGGIAIAPGVTPYVGPIDLGAPIFDLVRLQSAGWGLPQSRDALLVSGFALDELRYVETLEDGTVDVQSFAHTGWRRASMMHAVTDATGIEIAARSSNGLKLLRTRYDFGMETFVQLPPLPLGSAIRDLSLIDYDGNGTMEVAVLNDTHLKVYAVGGTELLSRVLNHPGGAVETLHENGMPDALALLRRNGNDDGWQLSYIQYTKADEVQPLRINGSDFDFTSMVSGDMDGDGDSDVAVQDALVRLTVVHNNTTGGDHLPTNDPLEIIVGHLAGTQGPASVRDYDYDGAADLLVPVESTAGDSYLVKVTSLKPAAIAQGALAASPSIFLKVLHEKNPDQLKLSLFTGHLVNDYNNVTVTTYISSESALEFGYADQADQVTFAVTSDHQSSQTLILSIAGQDIDYDKILFLKIQFSSDSNHAIKPTFLAAMTIDDDHTSTTGNALTGTYIPENLAPGASLIDASRTIGHGRVRIGAFGKQKSLPFR